MATKADIDRYLENWQDEVESSFLYRTLAKAEKQPALALVWRSMLTIQSFRLRNAPMLGCYKPLLVQQILESRVGRSLKSRDATGLRAAILYGQQSLVPTMGCFQI